MILPVVGAGVFIIIFTCVGAAGRFGIIKNKSPAFIKHVCIQLTREPAVHPFCRECCRTRESLVKVTACNYIVALCIFRINKFFKCLCLGNFSFSIIKGFQMEICQNKFFSCCLAVFINRNSACKNTAFKVCKANRPFKRNWERAALGRSGFIICKD